MPQFSIRLIGDDKLRVGLDRYAVSVRTITREDAREAMRKAKQRSVSDPPGGAYTVPDRGYRRTGNLSASTYLEENGLSFRIKSDAISPEGKAYSVYVIGDGGGYGQASIHQGYWTPLKVSVDEAVEELLIDIDEHLGESAEALGL